MFTTGQCYDCYRHICEGILNNNLLNFIYLCLGHKSKQDSHSYVQLKLLLTLVTN